MTDKAAEKLKASGWTIVDTTGFISLVGPLWQRVVDGAIRIGPADAGHGPARHPFCRWRQDRRGFAVETARGALDPQSYLRDHRGDRKRSLYRHGQRRFQDLEE
jgi:hypothetical protein